MEDAALKALIAKYPTQKLDNGNIRVLARLSFINLFVPRAVKDGDKKKYSASLLFPRGFDLAVLREEANRIATDKWGPTPKRKIKSPFLDQGEEAYDGYEEGCIFIRTYSDKKPGLLGKNKEPILDEDGIESGDWAYVSIRGYSYDLSSGAGVTFGLQNLMKVAEDDHFSGRSRPDDDFGDVDADQGKDASQWF